MLISVALLLLPRFRLAARSDLDTTAFASAIVLAAGLAVAFTLGLGLTAVVYFLTVALVSTDFLSIYYLSLNAFLGIAS